MVDILFYRKILNFIKSLYLLNRQAFEQTEPLSQCQEADLNCPTLSTEEVTVSLIAISCYRAIRSAREQQPCPPLNIIIGLIKIIIMNHAEIHQLLTGLLLIIIYFGASLYLKSHKPFFEGNRHIYFYDRYIYYLHLLGEAIQL